MIVVDASAVVDMLLRTKAGIRLAERLLDPDETLHVPHLLEVEVAQVLRRYRLSGDLTEARGREALEDLIDLPLVRYPHRDFLERMWALRASLTAYDAAYVALAEALEAPLLTSDGKLSRSHGHVAQIEYVGA